MKQEQNMARRKRHSKKRSSKRNSRRVRRNRGHRRMRRNPSTIQWVLLAGAGYLGYRWWTGQTVIPSMPTMPTMPSTAVVQPTPPPAVSGLGTLVVV